MIQIDKSSTIPLHRQIAAAIEKGLADGSIKNQRNLPSVRALAARLKVSPATVSAAYRDLVDRSVVEAKSRSGYRVIAEATVSEGARGHIPLHRIEPRLSLHPVAEFGQLIAKEAKSSIEVGGYEDYRGYGPLREQLALLDQADGISSAPGREVLVSAGAQHAIALCARSFCAGRTVAIEDPVYPGARLAFSGAGAKILPIQMDEDGPDLDALETAAKSGDLSLFYCVPTYGNPSGRSWPVAAREGAVRLAGTYGFLVLEDDFLRDLDYLGEKLPPLAALAGKSGARVIHVRSFSKCLLPALRIAGIHAASGLIDKLLQTKAEDDICGSALLQRPLARYLEKGLYRPHLERVRPSYAAVRAAVRERAKASGGGLRFENPPAGLCLLATLPESVDAERFAEACRKEGVLISPGSAYWTNEADGAKRFRIGFGGIGVEEVGPAFSAMERALERISDSSMETFFKRALL